VKMIDEKPTNETEILSADERKLREMCCALKKIDAPRDFDFKLRARIADSKQSDFKPRFGFAFRYALPALALMLVFGLLAYNGGFWASTDNQIVAETRNETSNPDLPQNTSVSNFSQPEQTPVVNSTVLTANQNLPKVPETEVAGIKPKSPKIEKKRDAKNDDFKGSELKSFKRTIEILPNGFDRKNAPQITQNAEKENPLPVKDVLSMNGINADFENGKWTVKSVTANSVGESSGVRENDVIEAIDNQTLSAETVFNKTVRGKTLTVTRGGEKSTIKLRNKQ